MDSSAGPKKQNSKLPKLLVILGPTASGKSELAVDIAKKFDGEVVSADSRQIYHGLDIGTGKVPQDKFFGKDVFPNVLESTYFYRGILHHLLNVENPSEQFSVAKYKELADKAVSEITSRGHIPILAGGTGFYIDAVVYSVVPPPVPPDEKLRAKLQQQSPKKLYKILEELDPERALTVEPENPRRLIRAIEIARAIGKVPPLGNKVSKWDVLQIGLLVSEKDLKKRIVERTKRRLTEGWIAEVQELLDSGVPWHRIEEFGLGYRCISEYLLKTLTERKLENCIVRAEMHYAKRQMRWFKRDESIKWFPYKGEASSGKDSNDTEKILETVGAFLTN